MRRRGVTLDWLVPMVLLLFAILLLSTSVTEAKDNYYDDAQDDGTDQYVEGDEYDDYSYDEDGGAKPHSDPGADKDKSRTTATSTSTTTTTSSTGFELLKQGSLTAITNIFGTLEPYEPIINNVVEDGPKGVQYVCPSGCNCTEGTKYLNCSHRGLTDIPAELPPNVVRLDLAHNNLKVLNVEALQNCTELQALLLAGNVIEQFDKELLIKLNRLSLLDLSSNQLSHLESDSFSEVANSLRKLHLSDNPLVLPDSGPFLELPDLEELYLAGCNLTELSEETFSKLGGLAVLDLHGNQFDEEMNANVFEPLENLIKLRLPTLSEDTVRELCEKLPRIDVIDITSYNISCFYLASDTSFEDSIIVDEPKTEPPSSTTKEPTSPRTTSVSPPPQKNVNLIRQDLKSGPTNTDRSAREPEHNNNSKSNSSSITKSSSSGPPSSASIMHEGADASSVDGDDERLIKTSTTGTNSQKQGEGDGATNDGEQKQSLLSSISSETMKKALMGIIGVAVVVLFVGLICRRTGMKSKLCGTKRRPAPTDQVRPAEEIPLNKV